MSDAETLGDRAKKVRDEKGLSQPKMAALLGISLRNWQMMERNEGVPSGDTLLRFESVGFNPGWILTGLGPERLDNQPPQDSAASLSTIKHLGAAVEQMTRMVTNASSTMLQRLEPFDPPTVKYIPLQVSAGGGAVVLNDFGMLDLDMDQLANDILRVQRKHMRLTQIKGDSMLPTLADGDIVIVDASRPRKRNEPDEGKIYVLSIDGEMYAKRADWAEGNNLVWRSDNDLPQYAPIHVRRAEFNSIQIIGEVLWSVRPVHNR